MLKMFRPDPYKNDKDLVQLNTFLLQPHCGVLAVVLLLETIIISQQVH